VTWFLALKYLHVVFAIAAVGANMTYAVWGALAKRDKQHLGFALRGIKFLDDRVANPAYAGLFVTGLAMVWVGGIDPRATLFVQVGFFGFIAVALVAALLYSPTLKRQIATVESDGWDSPAYLALDRRSTILGIVLAVLVLVIVLFMVVKPSF
jgi:uncharacterized membrane protein